MEPLWCFVLLKRTVGWYVWWSSLKDMQWHYSGKQVMISNKHFNTRINHAFKKGDSISCYSTSPSIWGEGRMLGFSRTSLSSSCFPSSFPAFINHVLIEVNIVAYCAHRLRGVRPWKREIGSMILKRRCAAAFTAPVFMQILIKRSSFPTTHSRRVWDRDRLLSSYVCRSRCSLIKSPSLLIIICPLESIWHEYDAPD